MKQTQYMKKLDFHYLTYITQLAVMDPERAITPLVFQDPITTGYYH